MKPAELYDLLKKAQEPKGYYFNKDKEWVLSILSDLLVNKERYGYSSCPCRLATGDRGRRGDGSARRGRGLDAPHPRCPSAARRSLLAAYGANGCDSGASRAVALGFDGARNRWSG